MLKTSEKLWKIDISKTNNTNVLIKQQKYQSPGNKIQINHFTAFELLKP